MFAVVTVLVAYANGEVGMAETDQRPEQVFANDHITALRQAIESIREHGGFGEIKIEFRKGQVYRITGGPCYQFNLKPA